MIIYESLCIMSIEKLMDTECIICLENVKKREFTRQLYCEHNFHKKCIDHWLYTLYYEDKLINCPLCRKLVCFKDINGVV